jgi:hypothetical protein
VVDLGREESNRGLRVASGGGTQRLPQNNELFSAGKQSFEHNAHRCIQRKEDYSNFTTNSITKTRVNLNNSH